MAVREKLEPYYNKPFVCRARYVRRATSSHRKHHFLFTGVCVDGKKVVDHLWVLIPFEVDLKPKSEYELHGRVQRYFKKGSNTFEYKLGAVSRVKVTKERYYGKIH